MEKKTIQIRGTRIGGGRSLICIPLTAGTEEELDKALDALQSCPWDMIEWRGDHYLQISDREAMKAALEKIRSTAGEKPVLFTYRTRREGGLGEVTGSKYRDLLLTAAASSLVDLVDVELFTAAGNAQVLVGELHLLGTAVIGSSHDFEKTPSAGEMISRLCSMQELGMDITKLAVMPHDRSDVIRLMAAAVQMEEQYADRPCVTMSMGALGVLSRVSGCLTGSAITFGTCGSASAPGQLPADRLSSILDWLG